MQGASRHTRASWPQRSRAAARREKAARTDRPTRSDRPRRGAAPTRMGRPFITKPPRVSAVDRHDRKERDERARGAIARRRHTIADHDARPELALEHERTGSHPRGPATRNRRCVGSLAMPVRLHISSPPERSDPRSRFILGLHGFLLVEALLGAQGMAQPSTLFANEFRERWDEYTARLNGASRLVPFRGRASRCGGS